MKQYDIETMSVPSGICISDLSYQKIQLAPDQFSVLWEWHAILVLNNIGLIQPIISNTTIHNRYSQRFIQRRVKKTYGANWDNSIVRVQEVLFDFDSGIATRNLK